MKRLFYIILLFAVIMSFAACSIQDPTIIGTWQGQDGDDALVYEFRDDGTGTATAGDAKADFTYTLEGTCLTVTIAGNTDTASVVLTENELSITDEYGTTTLTRLN